MDEESEPKFNPSQFFDMLRKSASVKAGAVMFGQAQTAYYATLKESMSEEEAFNLLAHTTEVMIRSVMASIAPLAEVVLKMAAMAEMFDLTKSKGDKEVPGGD